MGCFIFRFVVSCLAGLGEDEILLLLLPLVCSDRRFYRVCVWGVRRGTWATSVIMDIIHLKQRTASCLRIDFWRWGNYRYG